MITQMAFEDKLGDEFIGIIMSLTFSYIDVNKVTKNNSSDVISMNGKETVYLRSMGAANNSSI